MSRWLACMGWMLALVFSGDSAAVGPNFSGLWWNSAKPGTAVAIDQQDTLIFAVWMRYDSRGEPTWLFMPSARQQAPDREGVHYDTFLGTMYQSRAGAAEGALAAMFPERVTLKETGAAGFHLHFDEEAIFWFSLPKHGILEENWDVIEPFVFGHSFATCVDGAELIGEPNFQGLWWNSPAGSESGWGVYLAQQGEAMFGAWFTYLQSGDPTWFSMQLRKSVGKRYSGPLYFSRRTPEQETALQTGRVGSVTLDFTDRDNGELSIDMGGALPAKQIVRMTNAAKPTVCRSP